jgi:hypothetical protein
MRWAFSRHGRNEKSKDLVRKPEGKGSLRRMRHEQANNICGMSIFKETVT